MAGKTYEIEGLKEVDEALASLPKEIHDKVIKNFLSKAGRMFITSELKTRMPYTQQIRWGRFAGKDRFITTTDPNDKNAIYAGLSRDSYWVRWADGGTIVRHTKKGWSRGQILPRNKIKTIINSQIEPIIDFARNEFGNEILKILERKVKKIRKNG